MISDVTVVVATRNRRARLFETIPRHEGPVILVDNGSDDGSPDAIEQAFPRVTVVRLGENRGAAARNVGVELARTPYVAFADDDSYWVPGALAGAATLLRDHPRVGLLCARVLVGPQGGVQLGVGVGVAEGGVAVRVGLAPPGVGVPCWGTELTAARAPTRP